MRKGLWIASLILSLPLFSEKPAGDWIAPPRVEMKAGYFFFASQKLRDVYGSGGFEIQASGSYPIKRELHIYGSVGFLEAWGNSTHFDQGTTLWEIPVDVGLKPILRITSYADWYIAVGPRYFYVHQSNHSSFVDQTVSKNGIGLFANTGFHFFPIDHLLVDLFGEYSYQPVDISSSKSGAHGRDTQVGGFYFGAGLGYLF